MFAIMVCDGLPLRVAFARAGFTAKDKDAPTKLFRLPRVQERAQAILDARRTTGVVTLPEVTSMLQRVFAGAHAAEEYSAAHNAAFSLARLYGHVTDRATLEVIRRPSRDPDAPSEQALSAWVQDLPVIEHDPLQPTLQSPFSSAPASLLGTPRDDPAPVSDNAATPAENSQSQLLPSEPTSLLKPNDINSLEAKTPSLTNMGRVDWLARGDVPGRSENGAPARAVTGTPNECGSSGVLDEGTRPHGKKVPSFRELFGE
jgi:hypothetical protein